MTQKKKPFKWIEDLAEKAFTHTNTVLLISTLVLLLSFAGIRNLKVELDLYNSHNSDFPSLVRLWDMMEEFQDFSTISILAEWNHEPTSEQVCSFLKKASATQSESESTQSVFHIFKLKGLENKPDQYWFPNTLPDPCETPGVKLSDLKKNLDPAHPFYKYSTNNRQLMLQVRLEANFTLVSVGHWLKDLDSNEYTVSAIGPAVFQYYVNEILKKDSFLYILMIIFFLVFFRYFFGTWRTGIYFLLTVSGTLICLAGFMGIFGLPIDILTNSLFLITAIAATADYIFVCWGMARGLKLKETVIFYSRPGFFTTMTTSVGFISLCVSELHTLQRFGLAAAVGACIEWFFTFLTLPALIKKFNLRHEFINTSKQSNFIGLMKKMNRWTPPKILTITFYAFVIVGPFLFFKLQFEENPAKNFPAAHPIKKSLEHFGKALGWQNSVFIQFPIEISRGQIDKCLAAVKTSDVVHSIDNPYAIEDYFLNGIETIRREAIQWQLHRFGALKPYLSHYSSRSVIFLTSSSPNDLTKIHKIIDSSCPTSASIVGQSDVYREASLVLSKTLAESFLVSLLIVICIIFYLQKRLDNRQYFIVPLSLLGGPMFLVSGMALLNIPISPFNSMFLAILVGITGDNAIQYLFVKNGADINDGVEVNGPASIIIGFITVISSLLFLLQTLIPMKILGLLFSVGFFINLSGDLWILKGLLNLKSYLKNYLTKISTTPKTGEAPKE
jgi:predicted RND superfamily exporter protein